MERLPCEPKHLGARLQLTRQRQVRSFSSQRKASCASGRAGASARPSARGNHHHATRADGEEGQLQQRANVDASLKSSLSGATSVRSPKNRISAFAPLTGPPDAWPQLVLGATAHVGQPNPVRVTRLSVFALARLCKYDMRRERGRFNLLVLCLRETSIHTHNYMFFGHPTCLRVCPLSSLISLFR